MAHRGRSAYTPENSFQAFKDAHGLGVDFLETDAHLTKDEQVVLFHDATLDRTTEGTGRLVDYTLAELEEFDMGYRFQPENLEGTDEYPFRGQGIQIQTLERILTAFPDVRVNIDLKDPFEALPQAVFEVLKACDATQRVVVGSFRQKQIKKFREIAPGVVTSAGPFEVLKFYLGHKLGRLSHDPRPYLAFQIPIKIGPLHFTTPKTIQEAHERGIGVHVWTVNDPIEMRQLLNWGVDGIFTDDPELLLKQLDCFMKQPEDEPKTART